MKSREKIQTEGKIRYALGMLNEMAGKITNNSKLEAEGKAEMIAGEIQEKSGKVVYSRNR